VSPPSDLDYDFKTQTLRVVKQTVVPNYDPTQYATARVEATAIDGSQVPVSLVFHKSLLGEGSGAGGAEDEGEGSVSADPVPTVPAPLFLCGYGSYGLSWDPEFDSSRLPLLNRGVVIGLAHIRGGTEMG
jgi:oligopeptidase B